MKQQEQTINNLTQKIKVMKNKVGTSSENKNSPPV